MRVGQHLVLAVLVVAITLTAAAAAGPDAERQEGSTIEPSASATAEPGSSPIRAAVGRVSDHRRPLPGARLPVAEQGVRFSFKVPPQPSGWVVWWELFSSISTRKSPGGPISLNKSIVGPQGAEAIIYWTSFPDGDYADRCARLLRRSDGRSSAALAAAVAAASGTRLRTGPSDVTLGGHRAKYVVLRVRRDVGCDPGFFYRWKDVYGGAFWNTTHVGDTIRVWIVTVDGTRLFIQAATSVEANARLKKEVKQIVQSIRFE